MRDNNLQFGASATTDFVRPPPRTVAWACRLSETRRTIRNAMEPSVTLIVLISALMHASWNAVVKGAKDGLVTQATVVLGGAVFAIPVLFFVPFPTGEAWIYLALSAIIHCGYFAALATAYGIGDLGFIYPIGRGTGPVLVAGLSALLIGEVLNAAQFAGVAVICLGLFILAFSGRKGGGSRGFLFALLIGATIAGYSLTDGIGVRIAMTPFSYIPWLIFVQAIPFSLFVLWRRHGRVSAFARGQGKSFWIGGFLIGASYGMAMWAFSQEQVAIVMALRETAVIFGAIIGAFVFKEAYGHRRIFASLLIATGAIFLNVYG